MTAPSEGRGLLEAIVASRLQVLQSKRLMLASNERRLRVHKIESLRDRVEHLQAELERAQAAYRSAVLRWGTPKRVDYWPVAYARPDRARRQAGGEASGRHRRTASRTSLRARGRGRGGRRLDRRLA